MKNFDELNEHTTKLLLKLGFMYLLEDRYADWVTILNTVTDETNKNFKKGSHATYQKRSKDSRRDGKVLRQRQRRRSPIREH